MTDREAFEAWADDQDWPDKHHGFQYKRRMRVNANRYPSDFVNSIWSAWQAATAAEREACAALLDAEHERRKHLDNLAGVYARMIRERLNSVG